VNRILIAVSTVLALAPVASFAGPKQDLQAFRAYFKQHFPTVAFQDFVNGVYALDATRRAEWEQMESAFPPWQDAVALGKKLFNTPFANGKTYASCFKNAGIGIRQDYPYFDPKTGTIKTLEEEINACRVSNRENPLPWEKGKLAAISAYMAYTSRGKPIHVVVPNDPRALTIYEQGKRFYYEKRGQLNFSCADCHVYNAGKRIRADLLSPGLGQVTHFPVWRIKWEMGSSSDSPTAGLGTLDRRYIGCNKQVRAKPFKPQSDEYKALEYFHTYMSNGLKVNAPSTRQ
jgi:sulfur-oxidizing protein SoxA